MKQSTRIRKVKHIGRLLFQNLGHLPSMKEIRIGMVGAGLMAKAHAYAYRLLPLLSQSSLKLRVLADIDEDIAKMAAQRYGFEKWTVGWKGVVSRRDVNIVDIVTPTDSHKDIAIAALEAQKHVFCEVPLARNADEARVMYDAANRSNLKNFACFNYRRVPAIAFAKQLVESLGRIYHFRASYLQDWSTKPDVPLSWRFRSQVAGAGAVGETGIHVIDLARYLVDEISEVVAEIDTFVTERPVSSPGNNSFGVEVSEQKMGRVDVDDAAMILMRFRNGALGCIEATRFAPGRKNHLTFEINGSEGSIYFNCEKMNELQVHSVNDPEQVQGFKTIFIGPQHPYGRVWFSIPGLDIGWLGSIVHEIHDFIDSVVNEIQSSPTFYDGVKAAEVIDAVIESARRRRWVRLP